MKKILMFVALAETATGVVLLAHPPVVVRLLSAADIAGTGAIMSRLAGTALIGLGGRLLAWAAAGRHDDLRCACRAVSRVPWRRG